MAVRRNITASDKFYLGEVKQVPVQVTATDGTTPINITGWPLRFLMKEDDDGDDDDALIHKTIDSGIVITDGPGGECRIDFDAADTDGESEASARIIAGFPYPYSLKRTDVDTILVDGTWEFRASTQRR